MNGSFFLTGPWPGPRTQALSLPIGTQDLHPNQCPPFPSTSLKSPPTYSQTSGLRKEERPRRSNFAQSSWLRVPTLHTMDLSLVRGRWSSHLLSRCRRELVLTTFDKKGKYARVTVYNTTSPRAVSKVPRPVDRMPK